MLEEQSYILQTKVGMGSDINLNRQSRREREEFIVDSGASKHMMSKTDLSPEELETIQVSPHPTTVITANGTIDTTEEVTIHVKDLAMFVTVQLLDDTPAVSSAITSCPSSFFVDQVKHTLRIQYEIQVKVTRS